MGMLGRHRTILMEPREDKVKLPSDMAGVTTLTDKKGRTAGLTSALPEKSCALCLSTGRDEFCAVAYRLVLLLQAGRVVSIYMLADLHQEVFAAQSATKSDSDGYVPWG